MSYPCFFYFKLIFTETIYLGNIFSSYINDLALAFRKFISFWYVLNSTQLVFKIIRLPSTPQVNSPDVAWKNFKRFSFYFWDYLGEHWLYGSLHCVPPSLPLTCSNLRQGHQGMRMPLRGMKLKECPCQALVIIGHRIMANIESKETSVVLLANLQELDQCPHSEGVGIHATGKREKPL